MFFSEFGELFNLGIEIFFRGGWLLFLWGLLYMFYKLYMDFIQIRWYREQKWVFLKITAPRENERSPLAFEHIFNQLHAVQMTISWPEKYIEGQVQIWFTWEVTSIGGEIGNHVRITERFRDVLEAAVYSQFPLAEISETDDYFDKLSRYNVETSEYDIFAFNFLYTRDSYYPTKTYHDFEHAEAETIVDPITGMWEELGKLSPYEMYIIQFILRPRPNDHFKERGYKLVQKLKGVPSKHGDGIIMSWISPFIDGLFNIFIRPSPMETKARRQEEPPSLMLHLSEGEKTVISSVERKMSKWCYETKIQCMYIAPKEKYNFGRVNSAVIGAFKAFGAAELNSLKPFLRKWTKVNYFLFRDLEKPITDLRLKFRKREFMRRMKLRWYFWGPHANIMSTEEIASLIHFPQIDVTVPQIDKVQVSKIQPPPGLPIAPL